MGGEEIIWGREGRREREERLNRGGEREKRDGTGQRCRDETGKRAGKMGWRRGREERGGREKKSEQSGQKGDC